MGERLEHLTQEEINQLLARCVLYGSDALDDHEEETLRLVAQDWYILEGEND